MFNSRCTSPKIPPVKNFITVKLDSGASKHYFRPCDAISLKNVQNVKNETLITLPDGNNIKIQQKGHLPLHPSIDTRAGEVNIVPHLRSASLLSVGQFTNFGCTAELSYNKAIIKKAQRHILHGTRNFQDGLWDVHLPILQRSPHHQKANVLIKWDNTKSQLANFLHGCLFSPCPSTLMKAIRNNHFLS